MRFNAGHTPHYGGGIGGFFRPIIKFFKNIFPNAVRMGKSAINSKFAKKGGKALKKAVVNITADAISGGSTAKKPSVHITNARTEVADALRDTQLRDKLKKLKQKKKKNRLRDNKNQSSKTSFFL